MEFVLLSTWSRQSRHIGITDEKAEDSRNVISGNIDSFDTEF
jgi:hypothetical protein